MWLWVTKMGQADLHAVTTVPASLRPTQGLTVHSIPGHREVLALYFCGIDGMPEASPVLAGAAP